MLTVMNRAQRRRQARPPQRKNFVIGFVHPDMIDAQFGRSLATLVLNDSGRVAQIIAAQSGPRIATARNDIVRAFLAIESKPEWLFMVDTDMVFPPDILAQFEQVLDPAVAPIVGGLAFIYEKFGQSIRTNMMIWEELEAGPMLRGVSGYPDDALCRVAATGAACLVMHRDALLTMEEKYGALVHPWFQETTTDTHEWGEDITFCVRAGQCGLPIHVHTGIEFGHMKKGVISSEDFAPFRQPLVKEQTDAA